MNHDDNHRKRSRRPRAAAIVATVLLLPLALPASATADHRDRGFRSDEHQTPRGFGHGWGKHGDRGYSRRYEPYRGGPSHRHGRFSFTVPRRLRVSDHRRYETYSRGSVWYGPHRHYHRVYLFPVLLGDVIAYREHHYCGDALWGGDRRHGGWRGFLDFHFGF